MKAGRWLVFAATLFGGGTVVALVPKTLWPGSSAYQELLTPAVLFVMTLVAKLLLLATGLVFSWSNARLFGRDSPVRPAWLLMSLGLAGLVVAEVLEAVDWARTLFLSIPTPIPAASDAAFVLMAYLPMLASLVSFIRAYRAAGYPGLSSREQGMLALGAVLLLAAMGRGLLMPVLASEAPLPERIMRVAYPSLDFLLLLPTVVLTCVTIRFRGGRVFTVWLALLAGFVLWVVGDALFSCFGELQVRLEPLSEANYVCSYLLISRGAIGQHRLLGG